MYLGGEFEQVVVNDIDVTDYVEAELDRRHPAQVLPVKRILTTAGLPGWRVPVDEAAKLGLTLDANPTLDRGH